MPRGIRNNNPGNLNYAGQSGAIKEGGKGGRFAKFGSMESGIRALGRQLKLYQSRGINTIDELVNIYAPASDNNNTSAYKHALSRATNKSRNSPLNLDDQTYFNLVKGIINHENGKGYVTDAQIAKGLGVSLPGNKYQYAQNDPILAAKRAIDSTLTRSSSTGNTSNTHSSEVHVGEVIINTQATDAKGIAKDIETTIKKMNTFQADYGMN
jgi:hypothetical protein